MAREYSDETRGAVMAALLTGQSVSSVAREYSIPKGTVSDWKRAAAKGVASSPTQKEPETREAIGEELLGYVASALKALRAQTEVMADAAWIRQQPASELAVLHGVLADKTIRLLEALAAPSVERAA